MGRRDQAVVRFRHHPALAVLGVILTISTTTLAAVSGWLALLLVPPLAWTVWLWRSGTDAGPDGIRVRALLGQRRIPWTAVHQLAAVGPGRVVATLTSGVTVPLTAVAPADLPRLVAASGQGPVIRSEDATPA
ncbi:MAG TPA: PH domain-containing protein [Natronosporangium sp.]